MCWSNAVGYLSNTRQTYVRCIRTYQVQDHLCRASWPRHGEFASSNTRCTSLRPRSLVFSQHHSLTHTKWVSHNPHPKTNLSSNVYSSSRCSLPSRARLLIPLLLFSSRSLERGEFSRVTSQHKLIIMLYRGYVPAPSSYLHGLRQICDDNNITLIMCVFAVHSKSMLTILSVTKCRVVSVVLVNTLPQSTPVSVQISSS